ncbi:flavoprotein [Glycomyces tritici]|uniref:flavoprotein n=1 Tax=Glycomyces tritici TaxID=2665176 RepID=UPI00338E7EF4
MSRVVYLIVCGAGPAPHAGEFIAAAKAKGWDCHVITTPAGRGFVDVQALEEASGNLVISEHRRPGTPRRGRPPADAVVIAPASANTICKLGAGIADTYALDIASECIGLGVPMVVVPFVNSALAGRAPYQRAVTALNDEGVAVLGIEPHEPKQGGEQITSFPWQAALERIGSLERTHLSETPYLQPRRTSTWRTQLSSGCSFGLRRPLQPLSPPRSRRHGCSGFVGGSGPNPTGSSMGRLSRLTRKVSDAERSRQSSEDSTTLATGGRFKFHSQESIARRRQPKSKKVILSLVLEKFLLLL